MDIVEFKGAYIRINPTNPKTIQKSTNGRTWGSVSKNWSSAVLSLSVVAGTLYVETAQGRSWTQNLTSWTNQSR